MVNFFWTVVKVIRAKKKQMKTADMLPREKWCASSCGNRCSCVSLNLFLMSACEPVADAHHQIFRVMEFVESVSRVQEDVAGDERFQNQYLIESIMVVAFIDDVMSDAEIDGEYRHGELRA